MKILWKDLSKLPGTQIDSLYATDSYPAANVAHRFLNKWFISTLPADTVTIDLGSDMDLSSVFIGYCNCAKVSVEILNSLGSQVFYSTGIANSREITPVYFDLVQGQLIKVSADLDTDGLAPFVDALKDPGLNLKIKGIGTGCACTLPDKVANGFALPRALQANITKTKGGQWLASQYPATREREWQFKSVTWAELIQIDEGLRTLGLGNTTYFDFFQDSTDYEPPMHGVVKDSTKPVRVPRGTDYDCYDFTLSLEEAR